MNCAKAAGSASASIRRLPDRKPLPRPDLRLRNIPLGPVAVFGASNFPLAFSVAGGDTASALAAGCPVVVKGHPAHPGTSELVAQAIISRSQGRCGMPDGVFSLLNGNSRRTSARALVAHPRIKAVGFTGSRAGGLALMKIAAARPEPIPVYAEMSSINPWSCCPGALATRAEALAKEFVASLTLGSGSSARIQASCSPSTGLISTASSLPHRRHSRQVAPATMLTSAGFMMPTSAV